MMIDNSKIIRDFLSFNENDFYFIQVIKRRKDNPDMDVAQKTIKSYYVESFEHYDNLIPIIKNQCKYENARAYVSLNKKNYEKIALKVVKTIVEKIINEQYKSIKNVFDSVVGKHNSTGTKYWVVDVDDTFECSTIFYNYLKSIKILIYQLQSLTKNEPFIKEIQTKNGIHLITKPFNLNEFKKTFPNTDVHKHGMTILISP